MTPALFDLDGTFIGGPSCELRFLLHLARHGRIGPRQAVQAALFLVQHWPRDGRRAFKKDKAYLAGLGVEEVGEVATAFVAAELMPRLRPQMIARLEQHRRRGEPLALLSGAPDFIVAPLARRLACDGWRATRFATGDGRFLARAPLAHPFADAKVGAAEALCAEIGAELSQATAYADSIYDLPLLEAVARPVAVAPDRRLARLARARGWEVLAGTPPRGRARGHREGPSYAGR